MLVIRGVNTNLAGMVCFNGFIAIHESQIECRSNSDLLHLVTLVGHESMHSMLRSTANNMNAHTPDYFLAGGGGAVEGAGAGAGAGGEAEAGEQWEVAFWGMRPRWFDPARPRSWLGRLYKVFAKLVMWI